MIRELLSQSGLSLERLHTFCLIAESGGITKAAGGDTSKQPLFSKQLRELETFFGVELMRRTGRRMSLTNAGRQLYRVAHDYFGALSDLKHQFRNSPVQLRVGAGDSVIQWLLLPKLGEAGRMLSSIGLAFLNLRSHEISEQLEEGQIDLGILRKDSLPQRLRAVPVGRMAFALYVPKDRAQGCWKDVLLRTPLALLEGTGSHRRELENAASNAGIHIVIGLECSSFPLLAKAIGCSCMGTILPVLAEQDLPMNRICRVEVPWMKKLNRELVLAWNPRIAQVRSSIAQASDVLREVWKI